MIATHGVIVKHFEKYGFKHLPDSEALKHAFQTAIDHKVHDFRGGWNEKDGYRY